MKIKDEKIRKKEINDMLNKLYDLGITEEFEGLKEFKSILLDFENGYSSSGKCKLKGLKRIIEYKLSCNANIESTLILRYDPNV